MTRSQAVVAASKLKRRWALRDMYIYGQLTIK
ncbi:hypothetical protein SAMN05518848_102141 [Paenibacillus sp. PDC88]|nr:hypothetical protein SAMN05518848_102141 [Paenibacillus sp. PDC88]